MTRSSTLSTVPERVGGAGRGSEGLDDAPDSDPPARNQPYSLLVLTILLIVPFPILTRWEWSENRELHFTLEVLAAATALFVGAAMMLRFRVAHRPMELFVAAGFIGAAVLDTFDALVTSEWFVAWASPTATVSELSGVVSSVFLAVMMGLAVWQSGRGAADNTVDSSLVVPFLGGAVAICLALIAAVLVMPLWVAGEVEGLIERPLEMLAAGLFLFALLCVYRGDDMRDHRFERWLSYSLLTHFIGTSLYGVWAVAGGTVDVVHMLKVVSYLMVLVGVLGSIDELYRLEARLASELRDMGLLVENSEDGMMVLDSAWRIRYFNPALNAMFGWTPQEVLSTCIWDHDPGLEKLRSEIDSYLVDHQCWRGRRTMTIPGVGRVDIDLTVTALGVEDGAVVRYVAAIRDVTEQTKLAKQLERRATRDPLTGLPNRASLLDLLDDVVMAQDSLGLESAVLFLDLDHFKLVNDSLGHAAGDQLLVGIGQRIDSVVRDGDVVGRLGGDEFLVICPDVDGDAEAVRIAERVKDAMAEPFHLAERDVHSTMSIGVAVTEPGDSAGELLIAADIAAYEAKTNGRNQVALFDSELRARALEQLEITNSLRVSLAYGGEIVPYYQPIVSLDTAEVTGFEALARWHHPDRGLLNAGSFIEIAEETGLEVPLSWQIMEQAAQQAADWAADPSVVDPPLVNVNVSARQLRDRSFCADIRTCLESTGVPPQLLCIEITERSIMSDLDAAGRTLEAVRDLGLKVAIDDFGIGNSSLSYLRTLPIDILKIDMSFTHALDVGPDAVAIVAAVIRMTRALGRTVVAEGIETPEQMATLHSLRCDKGQGFLFSAAVTAEEATDLLGTQLSLRSESTYQ